MKKTLDMMQIASIAAASLLVATIGVAGSLQINQTPRELDFPAILAADAATVDYFLKVDGIEGESTDDKHKGEIEILSFSWGESNAAGTRASVGGAGAGKVQMQDFHFTAAVSKASPVLFLKCAQGEHIKQAILTARKSGGDQQEYLKVTLTDVLVSSYQTGSSSGDVVPTDSFSLNFAKIEFEYKPQRPDGSLDAPVMAGYDLKLNKKV